MTRDHSLESQRQALAEQPGSGAEGAHPDPRVDAYRLVNRAVRAAPMPSLPSDFAARVAAAIRDHEERARMESGFVIAATACTGITGAVFAYPIVSDALASTVGTLPALPWPLLMTAAAGLVMVGVLDSLLDRRKTHDA